MQRNRFRAPLTFNAKKFSRSCEVPEKFKISDEILGFILKSLYVFLLLSINMVLFAASGNMTIFGPNGMLFYEVLILLLCLAVFSFVIIGMFYKYAPVQNIICSLFTFGFIIILFNQFYQLDAKAFLGDFFDNYLVDFTPTFLYKYSNIIVAFILSLMFSWLVFAVSVKVFSVYVLLFLITFVGIVKHDFTNHKQQQHDFIEVYNSQTQSSENKSYNKFIYIMLPNFASHKYFEMTDNFFAKSTYDLMMGFLAKNNFEVFSNSYIENDDQFMNVVQSVNTYSTKTPEEHTLDTIVLNKYWNFFNINDEYVFLKDNQLFDSFKKAGYNISAYKSRGIDICHKNHQLNVDRCVEKINRPVNVYDSGIPLMGRTQLLFAEWISSMGISNFAPLYKFLKVFSEPEKLPLIGINYNNLYVINSIKIFDILVENIFSDNGAQAYFVYTDIPSDMFIYDEFCNIKPREKWINMENLPWIRENNSLLKYKSYMEQTRCLYGKLQYFIDQLDNKQLLDKTVIIINGVSSNHNFNDMRYKDFTQRFINDKMVALAIITPDNKNFKINDKICASKDIINNYLYNSDNCDEAEFDFPVSIKNKVVKELINDDIETEYIEKSIDIFKKWYKKWQLSNSNNTDIDIIKEQSVQMVDDIDVQNIPEIKNNNLRNNLEN
ncbi:MAG: hypothetical protein IJ019_02405 [Alphaproteobacteria bacterium]|nr:hypothetical protein [Alphaproteobacteria bacterium]